MICFHYVQSYVRFMNQPQSFISHCLPALPRSAMHFSGGLTLVLLPTIHIGLWNDRVTINRVLLNWLKIHGQPEKCVSFSFCSLCPAQWFAPFFSLWGKCQHLQVTEPPGNGIEEAWIRPTDLMLHSEKSWDTLASKAFKDGDCLKDPNVDSKDLLPKSGNFQPFL